MWDWYFTPKKSEGIMKCLIFIPWKDCAGINDVESGASQEKLRNDKRCVYVIKMRKVC